MWPDGICRVTDTRYTKTIQYQDINYQLSQNEDKTAIFEAWCDFLNYFDSSVQFQLSFVNLSASQETFARSISFTSSGPLILTFPPKPKIQLKKIWLTATRTITRKVLISQA